MKSINLETFANGGLTAQVNHAIQEVTKNIQNPNTEATAGRKITVTIVFKPNEQRDFVATGIQTKTTLAPSLTVATAFAMGKDLKTGRVEALEIGNQIPGQLSLEDLEPVVEQKYDQSTGEIYETETKKVFDLRDARNA